MTKIEWVKGADGAQGKTWNPVRGCSRVSPGCDACYAMRQAHRSNVPGGAYEGLTTIRRGKVDWAGMARLVPDQLAVPLRRRKPTTWFVNSMSDLFHESLSNEEIAAVFGVMAACPQHTFQILTKRAKRMRDVVALLYADDCDALREAGEELAGRMGWCHAGEDEWRAPLSNVWLGVSAEDQQRANERIPYLLETPAAVRFVSAEPLLGPINLTRLGVARMPGDPPGPPEVLSVDALAGTVSTIQMGRTVHTAPVAHIDWLIAGAESGPGARPMQDDWVRSIRDQCANAGVAFFLKQKLNERGHKVSLPLLDGVRHDAMPEARHA